MSPADSGEWLLWRDWCAAAGHDPQQPSSDALDRFTDECRAAPATTRRRLRVIRAHLDAQPAAPASSRDLDSALVDAVAACPVLGWPDALAGRRDAYLLALHAIGLSRNAARTTRPRHITLAPLRVRGRAVPSHADAGRCLACAITRWLRMASAVHVAGRRAVMRQVAPYSVTRADETARHDCAVALPAAWVSVPLLAPAIDQYGHVDDQSVLTRRAVRWIAATRTRRGGECIVADVPLADSLADRVDDAAPTFAPDLAALDDAIDRLTRDTDALFQASSDLANTVQAYAGDVDAMRRAAHRDPT